MTALGKAFVSFGSAVTTRISGSFVSYGTWQATDAFLSIHLCIERPPVCRIPSGDELTKPTKALKPPPSESSGWGINVRRPARNR